MSSSSCLKLNDMSRIKKKNFKISNYKSKHPLTVNCKGFLCYCNNREKDCLKEAYNLLNEYADKLEPQIEDNSDHGEIEDDLESELKSLKSAPKQKRFQQVTSGARNVLFIKTSLENPTELVEKIMTDLYETKQAKTRFLLRLIPISITCLINEIAEKFKPLAEEYFKQPRVFSIVYNHRNDNGVDKDKIIKEIGEIVSATGLDHKVNLKDPEISIIVEITRNFAFLGIAPHFAKYKKYNLLALSEPLPEDPSNQ